MNIVTTAHSASEKSKAGHALSDKNNMETSENFFSRHFFPTISHSDINSVNQRQSDVEGIETESAYKLDPYLSVLNVCLSEEGENAYEIAAITLWVVKKNELIRCQSDYLLIR